MRLLNIIFKSSIVCTLQFVDLSRYFPSPAIQLHTYILLPPSILSYRYSLAFERRKDVSRCLLIFFEDGLASLVRTDLHI